MSQPNSQTHLMLAQAKTDPGFTLPGASNASSEPAASSAASASASTGALETPPMPNASDTASRDLAIGGGIFLILLVVFFFARNAFVNHLVARRVAPSSAGSAGWLLFLGLSFISSAVILAVVNSAQFLSLIITGPLLLIGVCCLIGTALMGRR